MQLPVQCRNTPQYFLGKSQCLPWFKGTWHLQIIITYTSVYDMYYLLNVSIGLFVSALFWANSVKCYSQVGASKISYVQKAEKEPWWWSLLLQIIFYSISFTLKTYKFECQSKTEYLLMFSGFGIGLHLDVSRFAFLSAVANKMWLSAFSESKSEYI